jgi:hypothetical protein
MSTGHSLLLLVLLNIYWTVIAICLVLFNVTCHPLYSWCCWMSTGQSLLLLLLVEDVYRPVINVVGVVAI